MSVVWYQTRKKSFSSPSYQQSDYLHTWKNIKYPNNICTISQAEESTDLLLLSRLNSVYFYFGLSYFLYFRDFKGRYFIPRKDYTVQLFLIPDNFKYWRLNHIPNFSDFHVVLCPLLTIVR